MRRLLVKNKHYKEQCYDVNQVRAQNLIDAIQCAKVKQMGGPKFVIKSKKSYENPHLGLLYDLHLYCNTRNWNWQFGNLRD